ncbi:methylthioribulose 1-phosphate dehydratase [Gottfriedia luciferensis]|uniref:methylthioribulose 1-phosphate dehydratase n=1 Tax=Gottfriedia luciferensis TaxID=178774 RepID=UPI000B442175|nr:methylthioribulose 1-phosphate dehydratase [Gottfriedia luciferensis]
MSLFLEQWKKLANIKCDLAKRDWFYGTSGNLSMKISDDPLLFLVTADEKDKRARCDEEFIVVNNLGEPVFDTILKPSLETLVHANIYEKTSATCVLHVHTVDNNVISELFGDEGKVELENNEMIHILTSSYFENKISVPIIENAQDMEAFKRAYTPFLTNDFGAVLVRNHGITVWGRNPLETKKWLEGIEFLISYKVKMMMIQGHKIKAGN